MSIERESSRPFTNKQKNLTNLDLAELIRERGVRSYTELLDIAEEQRTAVQIDITEVGIHTKRKSTLLTC